MVAPERIVLLTQHLRRYVANLKRVRGSPALASLIGPEDAQALLERHLERAIECALDIAAHVVVSEALGPANTRADNFLRMARAGLIDMETAERLRLLAHYRNIIVHMYAEVTETKLYEQLQAAPEPLERFSASVMKLLDQK